MLEDDRAGGEHEWDALSRVALELRRPEDLGPDVDRAVMTALRAAPMAVVAGGAPARAPQRRRAPGGVTRGWRWLVQPRTIRVTPLGALAAAALAFVAATLGMRRERGPSAEETFAHTGEFPAATGEFPTVPSASADRDRRVEAASRPRDTVYVQRFMIVAPGARQVALVGDFNDWDQGATPLLKVASNGVWTAEVRLPPGRYSYAFLVDGQRWVADPAAPRAVGDDFGRPSSVVTVRGTDA